MNFERKVYDAWLATAELPYDLLIPLLHQTGGSGNLYTEFVRHENGLAESIPPNCRKILTENAGEEKLEFLRQSMEQHPMKTITILDADYPHILRNIPDPPGILFLQGNAACLQRDRTVAMVGSRSASYAGLKAARKIARELSRNGVTVISGFADGIDTECHQGCIEGGSPTIAVMGCGLDQTYPAGNELLKKSLLDHDGLILSEYAPGAKPLGRHFPYRNRIISSLADVVILMEAKIRSGSMTTIRLALEQGKDVYAYPGDPVSPNCEGNRLLLREGAFYFTQASDILEDMHWLDNRPQVGQNSGGSASYKPANEAEAAVYRALAKGTLGFDELVQLTGLSAQELLSTLTVLQIRKAIDLLPGKRYQISRG